MCYTIAWCSDLVVLNPNFLAQHLDLAEGILRTLAGPEWDISSSTRLFLSKHPVSIWEKLGLSVGLKMTQIKEISNEFVSSVKWQRKQQSILVVFELILICS